MLDAAATDPALATYVPIIARPVSEVVDLGGLVGDKVTQGRR
ncbi:MAG: hypothetical protein WDM94_03800 [Bauldia sp.]